MKRMSLPALFTLCGLMLSAAAPSLHAVVLLEDNFNSENGGVGTTNYTGFANWTVTAGSVDLIGNGFFDFLPGNGLYLDTDGSTGQAGTLTSAPLTLSLGNYVLSYSLAGSQRGDTNTVNVSVGGGATSHTLPSATAFTTFTLPFAILSPTTSNIVFQAVGTDNLGLLLDNVRLERQDVPSGVPDTGSTIIFLGGAMSLLGFMQRRFSRN